VGQSAEDSDAVLTGKILIRGSLADSDAAAPPVASDSGAPGSAAADSPVPGTSSLASGPASLFERFSRLLPLLGILLVQGVASGSLIWSNSAFPDEANYLWQGSVEWQHWLHGTPLPADALNDSGAPQLYPPIGALASAVGGLTGARLLSLLFMLAATVLLYAAGRRLFGRTAALWGAVLWAVIEPVLRLAFATYDPLSCLLIIAAVYCSVRSLDSRRGGEFLVASSLCLVAGVMVAVSFVIYVPAVIAFGLCARAERRGWENAIVSAVWQLGITCAAGVLALALLQALPNFSGTIAGRTTGLGAGFATVVRSTWTWEGLLICVAVAGVILAAGAFGWRHPRTWLLAVCAISGVLAPAAQAVIGTTYSLDKHISAGAGLAALAAGYAASRVSAARFKPAGVIAALAVLVFPAASGVQQARTQFAQWPNVSALVGVLKWQAGPGPVLVDATGTDDFGERLFSYYIPDRDWEPSGAPGGLLDSYAATRIATAKYSAAVQLLVSGNLERLALPSGAVTPEIRQQVLAIAVNGVLGKDLRDGGYTIATVLPYTTSSGADPAGVFVLWKRT
jgi:hypothetical protein